MQNAGFTSAWRFSAILVVAVVVLGVLNALPQFLGGDPLGVVRYATVEEAEARLGARLYRPAAVPAGWSARPDRVRLAVGGEDWIESVFEPNGVAGATPADGPIVLCQTVASHGGPAEANASVPAVLVPPGKLLQTSEMTIAGRSVRMQRLLLDEGAIVHELWWREGGRRVMLRGRVAADRLPRIAATIMGDGK